MARRPVVVGPVVDPSSCRSCLRQTRFVVVQQRPRARSRSGLRVEAASIYLIAEMGFLRPKSRVNRLVTSMMQTFCLTTSCDAVPPLCWSVLVTARCRLVMPVLALRVGLSHGLWASCDAGPHSTSRSQSRACGSGKLKASCRGGERTPPFRVGRLVALRQNASPNNDW